MSLLDAINAYDPLLPLSQASTPPSAWYTKQEFYKLEKSTVFSCSWLLAARLEQLQVVGDYVATEIAGQPIVMVRDDWGIKAYYNVCRHHAAQVIQTGQGCVKAMTCPYPYTTNKLAGLQTIKLNPTL